MPLRARSRWHLWSQLLRLLARARRTAAAAATVPPLHHHHHRRDMHLMLFPSLPRDTRGPLQTEADRAYEAWCAQHALRDPVTAYLAALDLDPTTPIADRAIWPLGYAAAHPDAGRVGPPPTAVDILVWLLADGGEARVDAAARFVRELAEDRTLVPVGLAGAEVGEEGDGGDTSHEPATSTAPEIVAPTPVIARRRHANRPLRRLIALTTSPPPPPYSPTSPVSMQLSPNASAESTSSAEGERERAMPEYLGLEPETVPPTGLPGDDELPPPPPYPWAPELVETRS
ncbi:hypothetical protein AMAG_01106 [Allomyces macrogynus ATCC 38327]|uniref:Uncharacterized protein n=1 Tax=Allomyces macrogynus (strain ATCC 38327) TaxID=578462 RepID=A0A0L0RXS6_ALLM3|nr:hypothetical protein AMAG_01106 [Allomyces macrogynus ATCC 38327]|eukprot:KNE55187.1 hypothetical protein AMAG_01106 [Allomyces macrogynus ATCC 38327]